VEEEEEEKRQSYNSEHSLVMAHTKHLWMSAKLTLMTMPLQVLKYVITILVTHIMTKVTGIF